MPGQVIILFLLSPAESQQNVKIYYIFAKIFKIFSFFFGLFSILEKKRGCMRKRQKCKAKIKLTDYPPRLKRDIVLNVLKVRVLLHKSKAVY